MRLTKRDPGQGRQHGKGLPWLMAVVCVVVAVACVASGASLSHHRERAHPTPAHSMAEAMEALNQFDIQEAYLPEAGGLETFPGEMPITLGEAAVWCAAEEACAGFTIQTPHTPSIGERFFVHFKSVYLRRPVADAGWRAWVQRGHVLRLPDGLSATSGEATDVVVGEVMEAMKDAPYDITVIHDTHPVVIQIDDFLTPEECAHLVALGEDQGYAKSSTLGGNLYNTNTLAMQTQFSDYRTSHTCHCKSEACASDPILQAVEERLANITQTHVRNGEPMQFTKYHVGEQFRVHNDYSPMHASLPCGARLFTAFGYIQEPEAGGYTSFPRLGASVAPKLGRVVIWPSVHADHDAPDDMSLHSGDPVEAGVKIGFNKWIHRGDYMLAFEHGLG